MSPSISNQYLSYDGNTVDWRSINNESLSGLISMSNINWPDNGITTRYIHANGSPTYIDFNEITNYLSLSQIYPSLNDNQFILYKNNTIEWSFIDINDNTISQLLTSRISNPNDISKILHGTTEWKTIDTFYNSMNITINEYSNKFTNEISIDPFLYLNYTIDYNLANYGSFNNKTQYNNFSIQLSDAISDSNALNILFTSNKGILMEFKENIHINPDLYLTIFVKTKIANLFVSNIHPLFDDQNNQSYNKINIFGDLYLDNNYLNINNITNSGIKFIDINDIDNIGYIETNSNGEIFNFKTPMNNFILSTPLLNTNSNFIISQGDQFFNGNLLTNDTFGIDTIVSNNTTLNIGCLNATNINIGTGTKSQIITIGGQDDIVNIVGTLNYIQSTNLQVSNKNIYLNEGTTISSSARGSGILIKDGLNEIAGYMIVSNTGNYYEIKAPENDYILSTPILNTNSNFLISEGKQYINGTLLVSTSNGLDNNISGGILNIGLNNANIINIGNNIINLNGITTNINSDNLNINSSTFVLNNISSTISSARGSGIYIKDDNIYNAGYILVDNILGQQFIFKTPENVNLLLTPILDTNSMILID